MDSTVTWICRSTSLRISKKYLSRAANRMGPNQIDVGLRLRPVFYGSDLDPTQLKPWICSRLGLGSESKPSELWCFFFLICISFVLFILLHSIHVPLSEKRERIEGKSIHLDFSNFLITSFLNFINIWLLTHFIIILIP